MACAARRRTGPADTQAETTVTDTGRNLAEGWGWGWTEPE